MFGFGDSNTRRHRNFRCCYCYVDRIKTLVSYWVGGVNFSYCVDGKKLRLSKGSYACLIMVWISKGSSGCLFVL